MSHQSLPRRRNGRPQACEPCRKRKISCDHALPVCHRCKRRKTTASCIYLAAPMTQKPEEEPEEEPGLPNLSALPVLDMASPTLSRISVATPNTGYRVTSPTILTNSSVFFGPTSFSAVFNENRADLETALDGGEDLVASEEALQHRVGAENDVIDAHFIRLGAKVLSRLPRQSTVNLMLERYLRTNENDGWFKPASRYCADSLWAIYGNCIRESSNMATLETVSKVLCQNARTPLHEPEDADDPKDWMNSFCGSNLRWEALGLILSSCCYGAMSSGEDEMFIGQDGRRRDKKCFVQEMKESTSICVTLCGHTDFVNPVMVALLYHNCLLFSVLGAGGDTSFLLWRHHGDLVSATTALGLHRETELRCNELTIMSEVRRRIQCAVFSTDKTLASFTGRPPFLSHRYSSCPMPLDISDDVLLMNGEERAKVVAKLDSNGWNAKGEMFPATYLRITMLLSLIRDEILEISLGSWNECLPNCIYSLKARSKKEYDEFPRGIKYQPGDESNPAVSERVLNFRLASRSKHLQNLFLLERLAIKYGEADGQCLLDIAREMLRLTLILYTNRDRFHGRHHNFEWLIVCFGVPSSSVLCFELLKQSRNTGSAPRLHLPRSETIQNLSLFIGFLNWVRPNAANYDICRRMKQIISHVLDQILEGPSSQPQPQPQPQQQQQQEQQQTEDQPMENLDGFELPQVDFFDFDALGLPEWDMLGDGDWMKAPWMGIS